MKKIIIIGGYGNTGFLIAEYLLAFSDNVELYIAGRNKKKAENAKYKLKNKFKSENIETIQLDANDIFSLKNALSNKDLVIVASSAYGLTENIVEAAFETSTDYYDVNLSTKEKLNFLKSKEQKIVDKKLCFITDGGFHPGLPAALIRYGAIKFNNIETANVYSVMKMDWRQINVSKETAEEMIHEFRDYKPEIFKDSKWIVPKAGISRKYDFGRQFGKLMCAPMTLEELKILPDEITTLKEAGFYIAGFNFFVDMILIPLIIYIAFPVFGNKCIKPLSKIFMWGLKSFSKPPYGLKLIADIQYNKKRYTRIELSHNDGYRFTAIPVVSCLLQYFQDRKPGLWFQAEYVEPEQFIDDLCKLGIKKFL